MKTNFEGRYVKNSQMLSLDEVNQLHLKKVCVIGCGGLGGYVIEMLGRIGVGHLTTIDGDVFDVSNLNRQLLSTEASIGFSKAEAAALRLKSVNSEIKVTAHAVFVTEENVNALIQGHDVVVDALDSIAVRKWVAKACTELSIPFVHGAIAGWYGQVSTIFPGEPTLEKLYRSKAGKGDEVVLGNPSFTPALVASIQVCEVIKLLIGRGDVLRNQVMHIDLLSNEFNVFDL